MENKKFLFSVDEYKEKKSFMDDKLEDIGVSEKVLDAIDPKREYKKISTDDEVISYIFEKYKKNEEFVKITDVYEIASNYYSVYQRVDKEDKLKIKLALSNAVLYSEKYDVYYVIYPSYRISGKRHEDFLLFKDEKKMIELIEKAMESAMTTEEKQIIMFTDTREGLKKERKFVENLLEKDKVVLEEELKTEIYESIDQFFDESEEFYKKYDIPHKRGILLHGEPGNGKTTIIKSLITTVEAPVVYWQITEYTNSESIKEIFDELSYYTPVILVIEDLESMPNSARSMFLNVLDGATTKEGMFIIGTTNYPEFLDPALINRPGRFDKRYEMKLPNEELRKKYLDIRGMKDFFGDEEIRKIAKETEEFSFVQLNELFRVVAYKKHYKKELNIEKEIKQIKETILKTKKGDFRKNEKTIGFQEKV